MHPVKSEYTHVYRCESCGCYWESVDGKPTLGYLFREVGSGYSEGIAVAETGLFVPGMHREIRGEAVYACGNDEPCFFGTSDLYTTITCEKYSCGVCLADFCYNNEHCYRHSWSDEISAFDRAEACCKK